jgi:very-short-patch-repair endonuclease
VKAEVDSVAGEEGLDLSVFALAARQHGVVTRDQIAEVGLGRAGIDARLRRRRLIRLHRAVYAVGHAQLTREGRWLAAVLACGPGAVLSHTDAGALYGIVANPAGRIHVTVPSQNGRLAGSGIRVHRSRRLTAEDVTVRDGVPVTTLERTLLDLADVLTTRALRRATREADYLRVLDLTPLVAVVERSPGRRGRKLLMAASAEPERTRSELEARALTLIAHHGIKEPKVNHPLLGYEIDLLWPDERLAVELDGYAAHGTRDAFQSDRARDRRLVAAGYTPLRFTHRDLRDGRRFAAELRAALRSSAGR